MSFVGNDQSAVIAFLSNPVTHRGAAVERIETHASIVFLAGPRAYKLKRAVRFDYLDFSTVEKRRASCEAEVTLNRRTAPQLYLGVGAVTRDQNGALSIDGAGQSIDWLVVMHRFPQEALLDRLAGAERLDLALMTPLTDAIVALYALAERRPDHGGSRAMSWVVDGNAGSLASFTPELFDVGAVAELAARSRDEVARRRDLLDTRRTGGFVRQCHGDLHLRNIVLLDGRPTLFDGVEFNDDIACTDVVYDLSFLLMDLWRRRLPYHANAIWNRFLDETDDVSAIPLLPLFLSCRAAVRAKTSATAAGMQSEPQRANEYRAAAREYFDLARRLLEAPPPVVLAIGGRSATGKSTLARDLAPLIGAPPGAAILRSDDLRKRMHGVTASTRLDATAYTAAASRDVYAVLAERAMAIARGGESVVVDATYLNPGERTAIANAAAAASVPFVGFWLDAPLEVLLARVAQRHDDASDADAAVVRRQAKQDVGALAWHRLDAARSPAQLVDTARAVTPAVARWR